LKFAGVPQTTGSISAASGPKFTILWDVWRTYCCLTSLFRLSICALVAKIQPNKVVPWCSDGDFWRLSVLCFKRVACSSLQTCIWNLH